MPRWFSDLEGALRVVVINVTQTLMPALQRALVRRWDEKEDTELEEISKRLVSNQEGRGKRTGFRPLFRLGWNNNFGDNGLVPERFEPEELTRERKGRRTAPEGTKVPYQPTKGIAAGHPQSATLTGLH